jgi:putative transposase
LAQPHRSGQRPSSWQCPPDRATGEAAIATFAEKYGAKYGKAVARLAKDREALLCCNYPPPSGAGITL